MPTLFQTDLFMPACRACEGTNWLLAVSPLNLGAGCWSGGVLMANMTTLLRKEPDGRADAWRSLSGRELEARNWGWTRRARSRRRADQPPAVSLPPYRA